MALCVGQRPVQVAPPETGLGGCAGAVGDVFVDGGGEGGAGAGAEGGGGDEGEEEGEEVHLCVGFLGREEGGCGGAGGVLSLVGGTSSRRFLYSPCFLFRAYFAFL